MSPCVPECHVSWRKPGKHCWRCPKHTTKRYQCHRCGKDGHWVDECDLERPNADGVAAAEAVRKKKRKVVVKLEKENEREGEVGTSFQTFSASNVPGVRALLNQIGIAEMHDWQREILGSFDLWTGRNLVFTAPTSAGKSLVSDVLMLSALERKKGGLALVVLPFVATCEERYEFLKKACQPFGVDVVRMWSGYGKIKTNYSKPTVLVCTPERASGVVTQLHCVEKKLSSVCFASVDELHSVQDKERGPTVEVLLTKLRSRPETQIVGMSATLEGVETLAEWLDARLYETDFRPVRVDVRFVVDGKLIDSRNPNVSYCACDSLVDAVKDAVKEGNVIVFCTSRANAQKACSMLQNELGLPERVAYHHAGFDASQRRAILRKFLARDTKVLCATSTVAAGVNLPADRVVVYGLEMGFGAPDAALKLQQMIGRAGRLGFSKTGSAVVFLRAMDEFETVSKLVHGPSGTLASAMMKNDLAWRRFVVEAAAIGLLKSRGDTVRFASSTLYAKLSGDDASTASLEAFDWCVEFGFVDGESCAATPLGVAVCGTTLDLEAVHPAIEDFKKVVEEGVIMSTPLQLLYIMTPAKERPDVCSAPAIWAKLDAPRRKVVEDRLGIVEDVWPIQYKSVRIRRTYLRLVHALVLDRIVDEAHASDVERELNVSAADVHFLREKVSRFARGMAKVCEVTPTLQQVSVIVERLAERIATGVREELLPLTSVPEIDAAWARYFFKAGLRTPEQILECGDVETFVQHVMNRNGTMVSFPELVLRANAAFEACTLVNAS